MISSPPTSRGPAAPLDRWVAPLVTQPLSRPVPADDAGYRRRKGELRLAVRSLRRSLQFALGGQGRFRRDAIDTGAVRRALWIHEEAPQIGDALMDLAPRSLLAEHGIVVELCTPPPLAALFAGDAGFERVIADPREIDPARYDLVIASSDSRRALATKRRCAPTLPWVSIAGAYNAPDFQRAMFGAQRLADLLAHRLSETEMRRHAQQKLLMPIAVAEAPPHADDAPRIAIACGGVQEERTYPHWPEVVARLAPTGVRDFILVGSANGRATADAIAAARPAGVRIDDRVGRGDLHAARASIAGADLLVCADGGLMHLGLTTTVRVVGLFTATVDPVWRLPPGDEGARALRSTTGCVADVGAAAVAAAMRAVLDASR